MPQGSCKILVCAPSNVAADNIVEKLAGRHKDVRVVRLGHVVRLLPSVQSYALDLQVLVAVPGPCAGRVGLASE